MILDYLAIDLTQDEAALAMKELAHVREIQQHHLACRAKAIKHV